MYCLFEAYLALDAKDLTQRQAAEMMKMHRAPVEEIQFVQGAEFAEAIERFFHWRLEQVKTRVKNGGDPYPLILAYWRLGFADEALGQLRELVQERDYSSMIRLSSDPRLDALYPEVGLQHAFDSREEQEAPY